MKKSLFAILLIFTAFILVGCKEEEKQINPNTPVISEITKKIGSVCYIAINFENVDNLGDIECSINDSKYFQVSTMNLGLNGSSFSYIMF